MEHAQDETLGQSSGSLPEARRRGEKVADQSTWRQWRRFRWMELWQAVALQQSIDPDSCLWHTQIDGQRHVSQEFVDQLRFAQRHIHHESLPIVAEGDLPGCDIVRPWEYAAWCDDLGLSCPEQMPRTDPKSGTPVAIPAPPASSDYLRQADLIPKLVPFSSATLWRYVKNGKFPAPIKLSSSMTVWLRSDYEAWKASHANSAAATRKAKAR